MAPVKVKSLPSATELAVLTRNRIAAALFGLMMIGAKDGGCDPWAADDGNGNPAPHLPTGSYCTTDPPVGCVAICFIVTADAGISPPPTTPMLTGNCSDGDGPLAAQFVSDVQNTYDCDPNQYADMVSYVVFPDFFNLTPTVTKAGNCTTPPSLPGTEPLSDFMGFNQ